jgi:hypothetical protein
LLPDFDYSTGLTERVGKPHRGSAGRRASTSRRRVTHTPRTAGTSSSSTKEPSGADSSPGPSRRFRRRR